MELGALLINIMHDKSTNFYIIMDLPLTFRYDIDVATDIHMICL